MKLKTHIRIDGDLVYLIADENKHGIETGSIVAVMSNDMYEKFIELFNRDPEYDEMLDIIHELETRSNLDLYQEISHKKQGKIIKTSGENVP